MRRQIFACAAVLCVLAIAPGAEAQASPAPAGGQASAAADGDAIVDVNRIDPASFRALAVRVSDDDRPRIDGRLDDAVWARATAQGDFIQREPRFGARSTERTEFRILYDDRTLYFGVWAFDSAPDRIFASELKRDSGLRKGDQVKIIIDTFHDKRNAFYFSTNPLGAYKDAHSVDNGRIINYDWNAVWEVKTSRDDRGWYIEMAIPLSQLRFKGSVDEAVWGLNLCRIILRKNEEAYWVPFPREWASVGFSRVERAGVLGGLANVQSRRKLELLPYVTPTVSRDYDAQTPTDTHADYGLDARIGLTSNLQADLTFKTDFAQVEADQEVVNLTRFSLFFPEKRQFFTESAATFDFGTVGSVLTGGDSDADAGLLQLFYSRRIGLEDGREVPILAGGKLTGRTGAWTLGAMNIQTDDATFREADGRTRETPGQNFSVIRVKRDLFASSQLGAIVVNREGGLATEHNRALGIDTNVNLGKAWRVSGIAAKTFTPDTSGKDLAGAVDVSWKTDRFYAGGTYLDVGERFNAEMGFIRRIDTRNGKIKAGWSPRPAWRGVRQVTIGSALDYYETHAGVVDSRNLGVDLLVTRQDGGSFSVTYDRDYDFLAGPFRSNAGVVPVGGHRWNTWKATYSQSSAKRAYGSATVEGGGYYSGDRITYRLNLNFVVRDTLLLEPNYTRNEVTLPGYGKYSTNVLNTRLSYSFSPDLFVKGFFQYNDDRKQASFNALLWYIFRPGSDLYVVYNQGWETDLPGPKSYRPRSKSLTVKMTYWLSR